MCSRKTCRIFLTSFVTVKRSRTKITWYEFVLPVCQAQPVLRLRYSSWILGPQRGFVKANERRQFEQLTSVKMQNPIKKMHQKYSQFGFQWSLPALVPFLTPQASCRDRCSHWLPTQFSWPFPAATCSQKQSPVRLPAQVGKLLSILWAGVEKLMVLGMIYCT